MKLFGAAAIVLLSAASANAASVGNLSDLDSFLAPFQFSNSSEDNNFGQDTFASYGQTVTFDSTVNITSFSFVVDERVGAPVTFQGKIAGWDGSGITDPVYTFDTQVTSSGVDLDGFQLVTVSISEDLMLSAGEYAFVFDSVPGADGFNGPASWGTANCQIDGCGDNGASDSYEDGTFIYSADNLNWVTGGQGFDSAFEVTYEDIIATPIAGTLPLIGSGLLLLGFAARRRRG